eukprot:9491189-Pyramimonas_sp.AAC.1
MRPTHTSSVQLGESIEGTGGGVVDNVHTAVFLPAEGACNIGLLLSLAPIVPIDMDRLLSFAPIDVDVEAPYARLFGDENGSEPPGKDEPLTQSLSRAGAPSKRGPALFVMARTHTSHAPSRLDPRARERDRSLQNIKTFAGLRSDEAKPGYGCIRSDCKTTRFYR